ncbi:retrotransposon protein, putative, ty1-copia subclass [Tanacetum coccineum]
MKNYVELEHLGYVLPQDLTVGLILNGLTSDFAGFLRNYNMHNMRKTVGKLHAMLIEYEKSLPKKAKTPQVMMIKGGKIQKSNKKSLKAKGKGKANGKGNDKQVYIPKPKNPKPSATKHPAKDDTCHHCKEVGHCKRNCPAYLVELIKKKKQVGTASSSNMTRKSFPHHPERATDLLRIIHTDVCGPLRHVSRQGASYFITFTDDYSHYGYVYLLKHKHELTPPYTPQHNGVSERRNRTLLDMVRSMMNLTTLPLSFWDYALESAKRILNMVPTKLPKGNDSGRDIDLEEIQDEDTSPSEITSEVPIKVEGFEPPQEEVILVRRSERTHRAPNRLCLNVEVEEHSLGDLNEPTSYKATMLDSESNKWIDTVGSKWIFKKKTDIDGIVHTYKARLVAKGYTQLYRVDYEETFSPVADIRAIRILISIAAYYDYEIWQMDVKTAFLNGYLDEDIYMVQPEGFVDLNHPRKICKLQRSIYSLKQASRSWNKRFDKEIKKFGFAQNLDEPCVYQKASGSNNPGECHWTAVKNILKYLRNTKDMFLVYGGNPKAELRVDCYCNAGFETNIDDMKSLT